LVAPRALERGLYCVLGVGDVSADEPGQPNQAIVVVAHELREIRWRPSTGQARSDLPRSLVSRVIALATERPREAVK
jgi:hypothetical protein